MGMRTAGSRGKTGRSGGKFRMEMPVSNRVQLYRRHWRRPGSGGRQPAANRWQAGPHFGTFSRSCNLWWPDVDPPHQLVQLGATPLLDVQFGVGRGVGGTLRTRSRFILDLQPAPKLANVVRFAGRIRYCAGKYRTRTTTIYHRRFCRCTFQMNFFALKI